MMIKIVEVVHHHDLANMLMMLEVVLLLLVAVLVVVDLRRGAWGVLYGARDGASRRQEAVMVGMH